MTDFLEVIEPVALAVRTAAYDITQDPAIAGGCSAAEALGNMLVTDEAGATMVTSLLSQVAQAQRVLEARRKLVLRIPRQIEAVLKAGLDRPTSLLLDGSASGRAALSSFFAQQKREAEKARQDREAQAREATAEQRAVLGDDDAPEVVVPKAEPKRSVDAGLSKSFTRRTPKAEVVHPLCVASHPEWFTFKPTEAWVDFRRAVARGDAKEPGDDGVVWEGVRFFYDVGVTVR